MSQCQLSLYLSDTLALTIDSIEVHGSLDQSLPSHQPHLVSEPPIGTHNGLLVYPPSQRGSFSRYDPGLASMTELFSLSLLQVISDWQIGGASEVALRRGQALEQECANLPIEFKSVPSACFRRVVLKKGSIWNLLGEQALPEKISSWTFDLKVAKVFKDGVPLHGKGLQGIIFERPPQQDEIIVNLWALFRDASFQAAIEKHKSSIKRFAKGMGKYGDAQCEIVLKVETLTQEHIYSLGGHSSSAEDILKHATEDIYGRHATPAQKDFLRWAMEVGPDVTGPRWLTQEATRTVLNRVEPQIPPLRAKKAVGGSVKIEA